MTLLERSTDLNQVFPSEPAPQASGRGRLILNVVWAVLLVIVLGVYAYGLHLFYAPATTHPDANGYWAQGTRFMEAGHTWFRPESNAQYIGMHWLMSDRDNSVFLSRYPPGLPVLIGVVWKLFGWEATTLINPVLAVMTLLGVFLIVARIAGGGWGLVAVAALAVNAPFTVHALSNISHMPVAFCLVWGLYLLMRWSASGRIAYVFVAGLVLGCIPTIRYPDAIIAIGVIVFLLWHWRGFPKIGRHYAAAAIGALIPVTPMLIRNQLLLGGFWRTGYALTNEQTGFSWDYFTDHFAPYLQSLHGSALGMMFAFGLIGLIWMLCIRQHRAFAAMLMLASLPFLLLYMAYYWAMGVGGGGGGMMGGVGGSLRFLVPFVPIYVIAGAWALGAFTRPAPVVVRVAVPLLAIGTYTLAYGPALLNELREQRDRKVPLALATQGLKEVINDGDIVVAASGFLQHLDYVGGMKLADPSLVASRGGFGRGGGGGGGRWGREPDAPSPMQQEKNEARAKLYTGSEREKQRQFIEDVRAWAGDKTVWVVASQSQLSRVWPGVSVSDLTVVKRVPTPKPPEEPDRPGRRGMFGGGRRGGGGGMFGPAVQPGEDIVIARWEPKPASSRPTTAQSADAR